MSKIFGEFLDEVVEDVEEDDAYDETTFTSRGILMTKLTPEQVQDLREEFIESIHQ